MRKRFLFVGLVAAAGAAAFVAPGNALAYGRADGPVAEVEVSGNCDNATWCNENFGGTGGFWIWAELDQGGSVDATFAGCGHVVGGGGGPHNAGAGGGPTQGRWSMASNILEAAFVDGAFPVAIALTSSGAPDLSVPYYVVDLPGGGPGGDFVFAVPAQVGHYNYSGLQLTANPPVPPGMIVPGVNFQTQVAP